MNRRNFFNKLGSFVVGCYLASGLKPLEKVLPKEEIYQEINPDYINAEYEIAFYYDVKAFEPILYKRNLKDGESIMVKDKKITYDIYPIRLNEKGEIVCPTK